MVLLVTGLVMDAMLVVVDGLHIALVIIFVIKSVMSSMVG